MQNNRQKAGIQTLFSGLGASPGAVARVSGDAAHPQLRGVVRFYPAGSGTLVLAEFHGLPYDAARCAENIFAMHIHTNGSCAGDGGAFAGAGGHYNPAAARIRRMRGTFRRCFQTGDMRFPQSIRSALPCGKSCNARSSSIAKGTILHPNRQAMPAAASAAG